eukprot:3882143-Rhodomonas_salina.1
MSKRIVAFTDGEISGAESEADEGISLTGQVQRPQPKRKIGHDANDATGNCFLAEHAYVHDLITTAEGRLRGCLFGFTAEMQGICTLPDESFEQVFALFPMPFPAAC